ncbi:MAG: hypothetical protein K0R38_3560, partial [Polyangiaceae bacterium]|nr:hypothetical protein [Polyangiaceae bacterium]
SQSLFADVQVGTVHDLCDGALV